MNIPAQPQTLAQKLIARASARSHAVPGEFVTCRVDLAVFHDSGGPRRLKPMLAELGAPIWDRDRVVLVIDHYVPAADEDARRIVRIARDWAREHALPHVYDSIGISHVVLPQNGHIRPGHAVRGRRLARVDRRRLRRLHARHRQHRDAGRAGQRRDLGAGAADGVHALERSAGLRRHRQGHDAGDDRPLRRQRRPPSGDRVLRRGGVGAVDERAHDAHQHERRTGRANRADRARRRNTHLAVAGRRPRHRARRLAQRRRRARGAPQLRCLDTGAADCAAAQPCPCARRGRHRADGDPDRPHRRLHRRQARRLCVPRRACWPATGSIRGCACWWRRPACTNARWPNPKASCAVCRRRAPKSCRPRAGCVPAMAMACPKTARSSARSRATPRDARHPTACASFSASPYTVAASALRGRITDPREVLWDADVEGVR